MNRLPLYNTVLKLQHYSVGRRLAHKTNVVFVEQGQQLVLVMRRFLAKNYCQTSGQDALQVDAAATRCAILHRQKQ